MSKKVAEEGVANGGLAACGRWKIFLAGRVRGGGSWTTACAVFPDTTARTSGIVNIRGIASSVAIFGYEYVASHGPPVATAANIGPTT